MARKRAGKIEAELGADACQELVAALAAEPNITLKRIQEIARERGIGVSLMGAKTFRDGPYERHLAKLEAAQAFAMQVASIQEAGAGNTLADASRAMLAQQVFEVISEGNFDPEAGLGMAEVSLIVKRLSDSDQKARYLDAKLREMELTLQDKERRQKEAADAISKGISSGGLTPEKLAEIERQLRMK